MGSKSYVILVIIALVFAEAHSENFGDFCNETLHCDGDAWLTCDASSTCYCANSDTMIYDPVLKKCVGKSGEKCQIAIPDAQGSGVKKAATVDAPECGSNSTCGPELTCSCDAGFFSNESGLCVRRNFFGEPCIDNNECQYDGAFLTCINGKCECDPTKSFYNSFKDRVVSGEEEVEVEGRGNRWNWYKVKGQWQEVTGEWIRGDKDRGKGFVSVKFENRTVPEPLGQCVGLAGKECNADSNCVYNSTCVSGLCVCNSEFSRRSDGRCGADHAKRCSTITPCADMLSCVNNYCKCPQSTHQYYDNLVKKCLGLPAAFCSEDSECAENTVCQMNESSGKKQCSCADGFYEFDIGHHYSSGSTACHRNLNFGEECNYNESPYLNCIYGLECVNGQCACADSMQTFNTKLQRCLGLVGSKCDTGRDKSYLSNSIAYQKCVTGASCYQPRFHYFGRCACNLGYNYTSDGFCQKNTAVHVNRILDWADN